MDSDAVALGLQTHILSCYYFLLNLQKFHSLRAYFENGENN